MVSLVGIYLRKNVTDFDDLKDIGSWCTDSEPQNDLSVKRDTDI